MIRNMKNVFFFAFLLLAFTVTAQNAQQEINEQAWKPFIKAFNENDTKAFMAVHSKDVVRSSRDSKKVLNWDEYFAQHEKGDKADKAAKRKRVLELRFTERLASKDQAVEVGVYRTSYPKPEGTTRSFYGRFHVVLRKEQGTWKILFDTDSSKNNTITEEDYLTAAAME
jgi:ketosteroid isomerase-like protein